MTAVRVLLAIVWTIFCVAMIYLGLRSLYRRWPTWYPYVMDADQDYVKDTSLDKDAEKERESIIGRSRWSF